MQLLQNPLGTGGLLLFLMELAAQGCHLISGFRAALKKILSALQAEEYDEEMDPLKVRSLVSNAILDFRQDCTKNSLEQNIKDFACTVVGAIISPGLEYVSFHIGDGAMVLIGEDDCVVKSLPENGEYANETYFATLKIGRTHSVSRRENGNWPNAACNEKCVTPLRYRAQHLQGAP